MTTKPISTMGQFRELRKVGEPTVPFKCKMGGGGGELSKRKKTKKTL